MFLVPLGFGRRPPRMPYITVAVTGLVLCVSIPRFARVEELTEARREMRGAPEYRARLVDFAKRACEAESWSAERCLAVADAVRAFGSRDKAKEKNADAALRDLSRDDDARRRKEKGSSRKVAAKAASERDSRAAAIGFVKTMLSDPRSYPAKYRSLEGHEELSAAWSEAFRPVEELLRERSFLTASNRKPYPVLLAQWTHADWTHMLGNLVVLFALAAVLEARIGALAFLALYLAGGTVGVCMQTLFMVERDMPLVGASANVSAVIGGFFVFFWRRQMKILFSAVVYNKTFECPTWLAIATLFVLSDVAGAGRQDSGVAHLAHLFGLAAGAAMAFAYKAVDDLHWAYLYPDEHDWHAEMRAAGSLTTKLDAAEKILRFNPENHLALEEALADVAAHASREGRMTERSRTFLDAHLGRALALAIRRRELNRIESALDSLPFEVDVATAMRGLDQTQLHSFADRQLKRGHWLNAIRAYDAICRFYPSSKGADAAKRTVERVIRGLRESGVDSSGLDRYARGDLANPIGPSLASLVQNASGGRLEPRAA